MNNFTSRTDTGPNAAVAILESPPRGVGDTENSSEVNRVRDGNIPPPIGGWDGNARRDTPKREYAFFGVDLPRKSGGLLYVPKVEKPPSVSDDVDISDVYRSRFASSELVDLAGSFFDGEKISRTKSDARKFYIQVGTGLMNLKTCVNYQAPTCGQSDSVEVDKTIKAWSAKSQARLVKTVVSLDWAKWLDEERERWGIGMPGIVTLTLPGDWEQVCPTAKHFIQKVALLRKRFKYAWGHELRGIAKREFQRRGAPHLHIFMFVPGGKCPKTDTYFREWLSRAWAEIVGATGDEFAKHLKAGTGVDFDESVNFRDAKRIACYFLKTEGAIGDGTGKAYQNTPPPAYSESVGRYWFVWGLEKNMSQPVRVTWEKYVQVRRILRKYYEKNAGMKRVRVLRRKVNPDGTFREYYRWSKKKKKLLDSEFNGGWVALNDGAAFASQVARAIGAI